MFLVLLIIFMVTSTALVESEVASRAGMKVVLPKANAAGPVSQRRSDPVLTVTKSNELYLGSHKVEPTNLEAEIRKALGEVGSETLLIRGDKSVLLGAAVDIMSTAKKAGASHIAILTAPTSDGSAAPPNTGGPLSPAVRQFATGGRACSAITPHTGTYLSGEREHN